MLAQQINALSITPDRQLLAAAGNPNIRMFEVHTQHASPVTSYDGHTSNVTGVGFHAAGHWMFSGSEDGTIKTWDLRATGCQRDYRVGAAVNHVTLHSNQGELVAVDQDGCMTVWDLVADKCVFRDKPAGDVGMRSVAVNPDGDCIVATNNEGNCFVYGVGSAGASHYIALEPFRAHRRYILKALFSPNGQLLATSSADKTIKLWNVVEDDDSIEFSLGKTLSGHTQWVWDCVFSADSAYLVSASSDTFARLWDLKQGTSIKQYDGHHKAVVAVALNDASADAAQ